MKFDSGKLIKQWKEVVKNGKITIKGKIREIKPEAWLVYMIDLYLNENHEKELEMFYDTVISSVEDLKQDIVKEYFEKYRESGSIAYWEDQTWRDILKECLHKYLALANIFVVDWEDETWQNILKDCFDKYQADIFDSWDYETWQYYLKGFFEKYLEDALIIDR